MIVGKAIYYLLSNHSNLTDIVGTRIFPEVAEQDSANPFVIYTVVSNEPNDTHEGPSQLDVAQVDVVFYSTSYTQAIDMGEAAREVLDRVAGTYNGVHVQSCQYTSEVIDFEDYSRSYVITQSYDVRIVRDATVTSVGLPVTVTDGDLSVHEVEAGGSYTCLVATSPSGIFYQRIIPWTNNDPGIDGSVYYHWVQGTYNYTPPVNPQYIAAKRDTYEGNDARCLLMQPNAFGNLFRFTNDVGEQYVEMFHRSAQNHSENKQLCIDHLTGLAFYVQNAPEEAVARSIADTMDYALNFSYAGIDDWRLADMSEFLIGTSTNDWRNAFNNNYAPFVDEYLRNTGQSFWLGTYTPDNEFLYIQTNGNVPNRYGGGGATLSYTIMVANYYF
jgi:hypothetical protein